MSQDWPRRPRGQDRGTSSHGRGQVRGQASPARGHGNPAGGQEHFGGRGRNRGGDFHVQDRGNSNGGREERAVRGSSNSRGAWDNRGGNSRSRNRGSYNSGGAAGIFTLRNFTDTTSQLPGAVNQNSDTEARKPDTRVTELEDAIIKRFANISLTESPFNQFARRPGYGIAGRHIDLSTNYLELKGNGPDSKLHRYSVTFIAKSELHKSKKRYLIETLLKTSRFRGLHIASDWSQMLVSPKEILPEGEVAEYDLEIFPVDGSRTRPADSQDSSNGTTEAQRKNRCKVRVNALEPVYLGQLVDYLSNSTMEDASETHRSNAIDALNIVMSYVSGKDSDIETVGRRSFPFGEHPRKESRLLSLGVEAVRGYFSSVRSSVSRILINLNVTAAAFHKSGPLIQLIKEANAGQLPRDQREMNKVAALFRKLKFRTIYRTGVYTITSLSPYGKSSRNEHFKNKDPHGNPEIFSIEQYFRLKYDRALKEPNGPFVICEGDQMIPVELCEILPGQLVKRMLSGPETKEMINFAVRRPHENVCSIREKGLEVTRIRPFENGLNTHLNPFGLTVSPTLLTVPGRILEAPDVLYSRGVATNRGGSWNLMQQRFRDARALRSWKTLIINYQDTEDPLTVGDIRQPLTRFHQALRNYGLSLGPLENPFEAKITRIRDSAPKTRNDLSKLRHQIRSILSAFNKQDFLFVILPEKSAVVYDCIKFICDCEKGIHSICNTREKFILGSENYIRNNIKSLKKRSEDPRDTVQRYQRSFEDHMANVAMKFNLKLGGVNHAANLANTGLNDMTIVFGIDVTHPSPGSTASAPSVAGVVASINGQFAQYPASLRTQTGRQEMVQDLEEMIIERLKLWQKHNRSRLPNKVIVYRDGVSESQYRTVLSAEYPAFEKAFKNLYGKKMHHPKMSIIVVGKRHHTRIYLATDAERKGQGNPLPGTVVDRGITMDKGFDFFLLAHKAVQGTAKPAHYVVLKDENNFSADGLQQLTNKLCYTFGRATRSVSVCPPAYYADIVCERGRCYLHGELKGSVDVEFTGHSWHRNVAPALEETMFYI